MKQIKIISGTYGFRPEPAVVEAKTPESPAFFVEDQEAARLVGLGVAQYVNELGWKQEADPAPQTDELQEEQSDDTQEPEKAAGHLDAEDLEKWNYNDLKKLAAEMGVNPEGKTKADYIAAIVAAEVEPGDEDDSDELPELSAADPE